MIRLVESDHDLTALFGHDLPAQTLRVRREGKSVSTFPDHALAGLEPIHRFAAIGDDF
ncbi:hypothetical protein [Bradyrhizobium cenepequi]